MKTRLHSATTSICSTLAILCASALAPARAAEPAAHVRGTIEAVSDAGLTVKTARGSETIVLEPTTKIAGVVPSSLDQIKAGTFIGAANVPRDGKDRALEVVVFPESMKGAGLGDYAWDLAPGGSSGARTSAMTNGTVKSGAAGGGAAAHSAMTNGTVKKASGRNGVDLVVDYGKGEKTIHVPADVPVVAFQPAERSALVKGAHVFVATKPGTTNAAFIAVGVNGTVPPM